ncbi:MAG TPA: pilus assembly protein TadG-related protein, partial [Gaiellaceae bacterium]
MGKIRLRGGRQSGQTLIIFAIAMPLFLSLVALVADGSSLMVHRRSLQVAADAAALAVAQDLKNPACDSACLTTFANVYSQKNGGPGGLGPCNDDASKTNCYQTPYKGNADLVEV